MSERNGGSYGALLSRLRDAEVFATVGSVLGWDHETTMPPLGAALRAEQLAAISGLVHERRVSPEVADLLASCEVDSELLADADVAANIREIRRDHDQAVRLPSSLVRDFAQTTSLAQQAWRDARERDDFDAFAPWLEKVMGLSRARAECLRRESMPSLYDALLDLYEPDMTSARVGEVFSSLRAQLAPLIAEIATASKRPAPYRQAGEISVGQQAAFNELVLRSIGFDFAAGRLDTSTHPFCEGIGPGDTRLTTRYRVDNFTESLNSALHEAGHGLYEQGLPKQAHLGEPRSNAASLGIHESQSRLWENFVGRSRSFWSWALPQARQHFGAPIGAVDVDTVYGAMNVVRPSLIRVESDEATYNLHIMLRFDLERALLSGELPVRDLPAAWNDRMRADLGVEVPDNRRGCLQDIHWSMGGVGYFPTYTLGNLYAAQLWEAIQREIPDLEERIARGEFEPLLEWLRDRIHRFGRRYSAEELCQRATGWPLRAEPFVNYLTRKLEPLYGGTGERGNG